MKSFRLFNHLTLLCCCLLIFVFIDNGFAQDETKTATPVIKTIEITGNKRIESTTILTRIKTREGDIFSADNVREDIKTLYSTDYFEDISAETDDSGGNIKLIFIVRERSILKDISFEGNSKITSDRLKEKITLITGTPFSNKQVKDSVERLKALYQEDGYYEASITPVINKLSEDKASVGFFIKEGEKIKIKEVRILGAKQLSESGISKTINTKHYSLLTSWLTSSGIYKEIEAEGDVDRIRDYYLDRGFIQVQVSGPETEVIEGGRWMRIIFRVVEGEKFKIKNIAFTGNDMYTDGFIEDKMHLHSGMLFNRRMLREDISMIVDLYGEKGYAFSNIIPDIKPDETTRDVDITLAIEKGEKIKIRRINIGGNEKTRDKVIRRELRMSESDYINTSALKRSFQRINNLNYFENVEIIPELVSKDMVDLNVRVKEKPTGAFSMGGGYSSVYGLVAMVDLTEGNLFGKGELLKLKGEFGKLRTTYDLSFREPWFMDTPTSLTVNLFNTINDFNSYKIISKGGNLGFGRSFGEYWSGGVSYGLQNINVTGTPPHTLKTGETRTGSVTTYATRDKRDNAWDTRAGNKNNISIEYADKFLGGDNIFVKYILDTVWYYPLILDSAVMFHGRYGDGEGLRGSNLPANEKFYVGGIYTVRGFDYGKASMPSTKDEITGDLLGADKELIFNLEYVIPLVKEARINGVIFYDAGSGFGKKDSITMSDLRTSAGAGLRWLSPIGPLRLEWGYNLNPRPGERQGIWEFSIGTLF